MKRSIVSTIIWTFVVFGFLPMILFLWIMNKDFHALSQTVTEKSIDNLTAEKSVAMDLRLQQVENEAENLAYWMAALALNPITESELDAARREYAVSEKGFISRRLNSVSETKGAVPTLSNVYMPVHGNYDDQLCEIALTARLDPYLEKARSHLPDTAWTYVISVNDQLRIHPFGDVETFESDHHFAGDIYFSSHIPDKNPDRKPIWTIPYFDWLGKGWVISCCVPIYVNDEFWGISGIDLPMTAVYAMLDDSEFSGLGYAFLIDTNGSIIYHPQFQSVQNKKGEPYIVDSLVREQRPGFDSVLREISGKGTGAFSYSDAKSQTSKRISYRKMTRLDWILAVEVNSLEHYQSSPFASKNLFNTVLLLIILVSALGVFVIRKVSYPIVELTQQVSIMNQKSLSERLTTASRDEIGALATAFNGLLEKLKSYTETLLRQNRQMETIVNSLPGRLFIISSGYDLLSTSECAPLEKTEPAIGKCYMHLSGRHEVCENCPVREALTECTTKVSVINLNGRVYEVTASPLFLEHEATILVVYSRDITERLLLEKELAHTAKLAEIGQVVAGITHELKSPLSIIRGVLYLLNIQLNELSISKERQAPIRELLLKIEDSVNYSENTIRDYLDFSKKHNDGSFEPVNIHRILHQMLMLEKHNLMKQKIEFSFDVPEDAVIMANQDAFKHILINTISNAVLAMPRGGSLKLRYKEDLMPDFKGITIEIEDTGCGISEEHLGSIYDPFFTTRMDSDGAGLGLWIVKKELEKMNGWIEIKSKLGLGTTVILGFQAVIPEDEVSA